jgi:hypothetical protein
MKTEGFSYLNSWVAKQPYLRSWTLRPMGRDGLILTLKHGKYEVNVGIGILEMSEAECDVFALNAESAIHSMAFTLESL